MPMSDLTDEALMQRISQSDASAFQKLLNRYSRRVYALAWRFTANQADAEDLTQEVFLKVWRHAGSWQPAAKLETWLYRITYNQFADSRRRRKGVETEMPEDLSSPDDTPEQALMKKGHREKIAKAVNELPERQKEALALCYYQGLKAKEAADILSVSTGALESLLFRARQMLKEKLLEGKE